MIIMLIVHSNITKILEIILTQSNDSLSIYIYIYFIIFYNDASRILDFGRRNRRRL